MKLLIVEDNREIAGIIFDYFELQNDYVLDYAADGKQGLALALTHYYDLIIMDIMLPLMDGLSVCKQLRDNGIDTPVLMLTARGDKDDILLGFEKGADDYLVKPFDLNILEARVIALNKRKTGAVATKQLVFSGLTLDLTNRVLTRENQQFTLNTSMYKILKVLMLRAPDVAKREEVIKEIWGDDAPDMDIIRTHMYQLRAQIDKPFKHQYIKTIPKVGYQLIASCE